MNERESPLLVGWKQIAAYLHCAESTARRQAREKGLPVFRVGGSVRAHAADIDRWLEAQPRTEAAAGEGEEPRALILEGDDLPTALSSLGGRAARYRYALIPLGVKEAEFARIQQLLHSAEERYQRLVEQVPVWIWETDAAGEFTYSNPRSFEILGYEAGDFAGYTPTEFAVAPEDAERFERSFAAVRESGSIVKRFRCRFVHRDGSRRWLETDAEPAFAADGRFAGVRGVSRDVTDAVVAEEELRQHRDRLEELVAARTAELQKVNAGLQREIAERERAERDLEEQRNRLRTIFTVTPDLLVLLDRDFVYRAVNPAFCHYMGMREEELLGRTDFDVFPRPRAEVYRRSDEDVLASAELHILEREAADADGTTRWLQVAKAPIFDAAGEASGLLVSARDITAQKGIEAALRESEDKFRTLAEESPNMIFINQGERVVYANKESEKVTGYAREEFYAPDFDFLCLIAPASQELINRNFAAHMVGEDVPPYEYTLLTRTGEAVDVVLTTKLIRFGTGRATLGIATDITERKRAEGALRESEEKYRFLINSADFPIMFYDTDLKLALINKSGARNLDGQPEDFVGKTPAELFAEMGESIAAQLERVISSGKSEEAEDRMTLPSSQRWFWSNLHCVRNTAGEKMGVLIISHDITARRQAERAIKYYTDALRESEEKYRDLFENANDLIQSVTPEGRFVYVNRAWKETLGYDEDELKELPLFDIIHPDSRAHCRELFERVISGERLDNIEAVFVTKEGDEVGVEGSASCRFEHGKPVSTRGIFRDVTARKRAEEELRASEARFRQILETAGEGVWLIDRDGKTTFANERMARMLGCDLDEFLASHLFDFMDEEGRAQAAAYMERRRQGIGEQHDFRFRRKDGSTLWALLEAASVLGPDGEYEGALAMVTDITERKQAEERLRASEERLRALFELSAEAIIILDPRGTVVDLNRRLSEWLGYEAADVVGKNFADVPFAPTEDIAKSGTAMRRRFGGEKVPPYELTLIAKNGEPRRGRVRGHALRNESGEPVADLVMITPFDGDPAEAAPPGGPHPPP
jgi:PAS domain S-box-containing protein/excisionase family DNA binding protein